MLDAASHALCKHPRRHAAAAVHGHPARGIGARRRTCGAGELSAIQQRRSGAVAAARLSRPGVRDPVSLHGRPRAGRPARDHRSDVHRCGLWQRRNHARHHAGAGAAAVARVDRSDPRVQGCGTAVAGQPVRACAREAGHVAQHPGCDVGRHRAVGGVRHARQAQRRRVHAHAARENEPVPGRADVRAARSEHLQHRHRRRIRRLPGSCQGGGVRCGVQAPVSHRHGQLDQLGAGGGAGRVLLQRLLRRDARQRRDRSALRCRRAISATSSRAMSRGRWGCRSTS